MSPRPEVSVIVELDNLRLAGADRARAMALRLRADLERMRPPVEVIVAYDEEEVAGEDVRTLFAPLDVQLVAGPDGSYYRMKNLGAERASGTILVFLDSDVVPDPGWLPELLRSFDDPDVQVVGGNAYVEPSGIWGKTFALAWFFPLRADRPALEPRANFFANNVAFRREVFERFPFPDAPGTARGACLRLASTLHAHGITVYRNAGAQVSHPAPAGPRRALVRALAQGRDRAVLARDSDGQQGVLPPRLARRVIRSLLLERRRVGLSLGELPLAAAIAGLYYAVALGSALATILRPRFMERRFRL
jgi:glycosyl transferase family 2